MSTRFSPKPKKNRPISFPTISTHTLNIDVAEITTIVDTRVELPCNITPRAADDSVQLVLWYKTVNATGPPIYSIDLRSSPPAQLASDAYVGRASFNTSTTPTAILAIDRIRINDTGWFSCRVDYKWSRTTLFNILLHVNGEFV